MPTRDLEEECQGALYSSSWQIHLKSVIYGARTGKRLSVLFGPEDVRLEVREKAGFLWPFLSLSPTKENDFCTEAAAGAC